MGPSPTLTGSCVVLPSSLSSNDHHLSKQDSNTKVNIALAKPRGVVVMWRIWPAVLLHTTFAAIIVVISTYTTVKMDIPNIVLTLLGVVIGFVISLRVSSGYDRYWWGRCAWSDLIKNSRTMSRLIWIHVPPQLKKVTVTQLSFQEERGQAMREKRMMMNLIEAYAVSLKHYVRGELGIYYEDLYRIVRPFHEHRTHPRNLENGQENGGESSTVTHQNERVPAANSSHTHLSIPAVFEETALVSEDPEVPPMNSYGSTVTSKSRPIHQNLGRTPSNVSFASFASDSSIREPLLPAELSLPNYGPSQDLMPFGSFIVRVGHFISPYTWYIALRDSLRTNSVGDEESGQVNRYYRVSDRPFHSARGGRRRRAARQIHCVRGKHQPRLAGDGDNLPLEIIRCMSEWVCVLESRGVASGNVIGGIYGCVAAYEDILGTLERISTSPLPYILDSKSTPKNNGLQTAGAKKGQTLSTVWLYLFFLPFQLAEEFQWYTIPGVAVAAFFYLGFLAAGDEIEQPFGYDEDDLDLDLFCQQIIKADLQMLMTTPCPNAPTGSQRLESDIIEARTVVELCTEEGAKKGKHVDDEHESIAVYAV